MQKDDILNIRELSYKYPRGQDQTLQDITYRLDEPRFVAIMGATGSGKTTLAMCLNGLVPQFFEGEMKGSVSVAGLDTQKYRIQTLVSRVGLVMQDPETQIFGITVEEDIAFGPGNMGLPADEIARRIQEVLPLVRLSGYQTRATGELSGGEKQRLAIAGMLAMHPEVILLDEPTSELDPLGRVEIYEAVDRLRRERNLTILAVEHSSEDIAERADELLVVQEGRIVWSGSPRQLFCRVPLAEYYGIRPPQVSEFGWRLHELGLIPASDVPLTVDEAAEMVRGLIGEKHATASNAMEAAPAVGRERIGAGPAAIVVHNLEHDYGTMHALRGISLEIKQGEFVALIGQNGAGKSTLVKHFNNLLKPTGGEVFVDGIDTRAKTMAELSRHVGYVFQNPDHQIFCASVREEVGYGLRHLNLPADEIRERVDEVLRFVGIEKVADRHPFTLGKGERQRIAVASVLVLKPNILVIDEPTTGQDWNGAQYMMHLVRELHDAGHTIVMITHDMRIVAEYAERAVVMHKGRLVADGTVSEVFGQREVLNSAYLAPPQIAELEAALPEWPLFAGVTTVDDAVARVISYVH